MKTELKIIYENLDHTAFWVCLVISIALIVTSFFIPPLAVIDSSVLAAVGELFAFGSLAAVIVAIKKGRDISISHGQTNVSINSDDIPDGEEA